MAPVTGAMREPCSPHELLYRTLRDQQYCDVLVDRMAGFPFRDEIVALADSVAPRRALADPIFEESPDQAPLLVRLPVGEIALIEQILAQALADADSPAVQTRPICAFVFSQLGLDRLAAHLTRSMNLRVEGQGNIYFRFFDPRVAHHLARILTPEQLAGIFPGVRHWAYVDPAGRLRIADHAAAPPGLFAPTLTAAQWQELARIEAFNLAVRLLRQAGHLLDDGTEQDIHHALRAAQAAGLASSADQATYAAWSVAHGDAFRSRPDLAASIGTAVDNGIPLADVLEQHIGRSL
ncbi:DUF4123 domain-containing protein [Pseudoduganella albidiflava]|nr:DUF4123 domain-containing protein [Pseudoduganella albidiflava]GGY31214.1 hypothetical protein GCM10007387_11530 [Pseudoduganella albidiflava]